MRIRQDLPRRRLSRSAFTLIEIMIVVMIMGLLAMVAIPNVKRYMDTAKYQAIIANLKAIDLAKQTWGNENRKGDDATPSEQDLSPYFSGEKFPVPVAGEAYNIKSLKERPTATAGSKLHGVDAGGEITMDVTK